MIGFVVNGVAGAVFPGPSSLSSLSVLCTYGSSPNPSFYCGFDGLDRMVFSSELSIFFLFDGALETGIEIA